MPWNPIGGQKITRKACSQLDMFSSETGTKITRKKLITGKFLIIERRFPSTKADLRILDQRMRIFECTPALFRGFSQ